MAITIKHPNCYNYLWYHSFDLEYPSGYGSRTSNRYDGGQLVFEPINQNTCYLAYDRRSMLEGCVIPINILQDKAFEYVFDFDGKLFWFDFNPECLTSTKSFPKLNRDSPKLYLKRDGTISENP